MQHNSEPFSRFLAIPLLAGIAVLGVAGSQPAPPDPVDPELREIIERALERAAWAEEEGFETRYRRAMTQRVQRFNGDGEVTDDETLLYQVEPYQGALFSRLMARDGEPIDARGRREQERRWEEFQAEIDDPGKRAEREREAEENEIKVGRRAGRPVHGQAGRGAGSAGPPQLPNLVRAPAGEASGAQADRPRPEQVAGRGLDRHGDLRDRPDQLSV